MDWKSLLGSAAPIIGGLLGGPAGSAVGGLVAKALGVGETKGDLEAALKAKPELIAKIKQLEIEQGSHLADLAAQLQQGQIDTNKIYAASPSIFKSGGRPFLLWVCGAAFAWQYLLGPFAAWLAALAGHATAMPTLDLSVMLPVLLGLLGLGTMQSIDRYHGVSNETGSLIGGPVKPPKFPSSDG